jgi:hypothetical protein
METRLEGSPVCTPRWCLLLLGMLALLSCLAAETTGASPPSSSAGVKGMGFGGYAKVDPEDQAAPADPDQVLPLPEAEGTGNLPKLKFGEKLRFEEWGPIVINADGTTRRISNWDMMTKAEQERTWTRIAKRNKERLEALNRAGGAAGETPIESDLGRQPEPASGRESPHASEL